MNTVLIAVASVLSVLMGVTGNDYVTLAAAISTGVVWFAFLADFLDIGEVDGSVVQAYAVIGTMLTLFFAWFAGMLGFLVCAAALSIASLCAWQRHRLMA